MKLWLSINVLMFLTFGNLYTQVPDTIWTKIHDITLDIDEGDCVRQTSDGGYIITGNCVPNGLVSHSDVLLLKTDVLGNIEWAKVHGKGFFESASAVEQTTDGGYIIAGRALTGSYPFIDPPISDAWILKTDPAGDTLWTKTYGGDGNEYCTSVQQTSDLGYIFAGTMNSEYSYPHYEVNENYEPDSSKAWLIKTDSAGDTLWTKTYFQRSHGNGVIQTSEGGYMMVGWIFPDDQSNQSDVLLIKTDASGDTLWTNIVQGEDYEIGYCVRQTTDGYIVAGQTKAAGEPYDALLIKINSSGELLWSKTFGGYLSDVSFTVEVANNEYFVTGSANGTWWVTAWADMWAFKTDSDGNLLWEKIYDIRLCDIAFSGIPSADGGYVITGMTSHGFGGDLWLAKLHPNPSGITDNPGTVNDYVLYQNYPNPFNPTTVISWQLQVSSSVRLAVYTLTGQRVAILVDKKQPAGSHSIEFDASHFSSGVYFYRLEAGDNIETRKMILMR